MAYVFPFLILLLAFMTFKFYVDVMLIVRKKPIRVSDVDKDGTVWGQSRRGNALILLMLGKYVVIYVLAGWFFWWLIKMSFFS